MIDAKDIQYRKFRKSDFQKYKDWFSDPETNKWLGPLDADWLDYVLKDTTGAQFCFTSSNALIAVAGVHFPNNTHPYYVITDIAVRPNLRAQGLGLRILSLLQTMPALQTVSFWRANVSSTNDAAIHLFEKSNWTRLKSKTSNDGMIIFENLLV